jgi:hypothetical protein
MPNLTPDSGTAGRSIFYAALPSIIGGTGGAAIGGAVGGEDGAQTGAGIGTGLTLGPTAALAVLYSKPGQKAIQKALLGPRSKALDVLGDYLKKRAKQGGMFASGIGRDIFLQPELPQ